MIENLIFREDFDLESVEEEDSVVLPTGEEVEEVAVLFDKDLSVLLKIGDKDKVKNYFDTIHLSYRQAGFFEQARDFILMELPTNQALVDQLINTSGSIEKIFQGVS